MSHRGIRTGLDTFVHDGVSRLTGSAPCVNLEKRAVHVIQVQIEYGRWAAALVAKQFGGPPFNQEGEPPMAQSTLRENRRSATHQNATVRNQARMMVLVAEPFYQYDHLGPGAPLTHITGQGEGNGYYDWAGRRLFLTDGEPDPMCPGAYRYQHNPAACDLEAPDSDPRSPRYEPIHLRHRPGDTWIIDTHRPHDPFDPGPFGTPGWYPDQRSGRHRRDETPDPLPAEGWTPPADAWFPGTADWPEPEAAQPVPSWQGRRDQPRTGDRPGSDSGGTSGNGDADGSGRGGATGSASGRGPTPPRSRRPIPAPGDEPPQDDQRGQGRFWDAEQQITTSDDFRFSRMREAAFDRFMANSAQLRAAHFQPERPYLRERAAWILRWLLWVIAFGLAPMPTPLTTRYRQPEPAAPQPIPHQLATESRPRQIPDPAAAPAPERLKPTTRTTPTPHPPPCPAQRSPPPSTAPAPPARPSPPEKPAPVAISLRQFVTAPRTGATDRARTDLAPRLDPHSARRT